MPRMGTRRKYSGAAYSRKPTFVKRRYIPKKQAEIGEEIEDTEGNLAADPAKPLEDLDRAPGASERFEHFAAVDRLDAQMGFLVDSLPRSRLGWLINIREVKMPLLPLLIFSLLQALPF